MSWYEIEKFILGIRIEEPPYEVRMRIRNFEARTWRWITDEEIEESKEEGSKLIEKYLKRN